MKRRRTTQHLGEARQDGRRQEYERRLMPALREAWGRTQQLQAQARRQLDAPDVDEDRPLSADDQLWMLETDEEWMRGVPYIGAGRGAIKGEHPEDCIPRIDRMRARSSIDE